MNDTHRPSAEFVSALGANIESAMRRRDAFANGEVNQTAVGRTRWRMFACVAVIAGASMCIGGAGAFAVVKKRESQMADLNIARARTVLEYSRLQLDMYGEEYNRIKQLVEEGMATEQELTRITFEIHNLYATQKIRELELEEVEATGFDADNRLTAPLVDGRDFVTERLELERQIAIGGVELLHSELNKPDLDPHERQALMSEVESRMLATKAVDEKIGVRKQYLDGKVSATDLEWHQMYESAARGEREAAIHLERAHAALEEERERAEMTGDELTLGAMEYEARTAELHYRLAKLEMEAAQRRIKDGRENGQ